MTLVHRAAVPVLAAALAACSSAAPTSQRVADCSGAAEAKLAALGIERANIESTVLNIERASEGGGIMGRSTWTRLKTCQGYLVMRMDSGCQVIDMYSTGNCALPPGAKS